MKSKTYVIFNIILTTLIMTIFIIVGIDHFIIFNKKAALVIFITGYIFLVYLGMRMQIRYKKKNIFNVLLNVFAPLGLYLAGWYAVEIRARYLTNVLCIFLISAVLEFFWVQEKNKNRVQNFKRYLGRELFPTACIVFILMGSIAVFGQIKAQEVSQLTADTIYQNWDEYRIEDSLTYNMAEASAIERWSELPKREKEKILKLFCRIESRYYGMNDVPKLIITELDENIVGQYSRGEDTIFITQSMMDETDGYEVLFTLFHEMAHRQQYIQTELYYKILQDEDYSDYYDNSIWLETMTYAKELENYIPGDEDNIEDYNKQEIEEKANYYAAVAVQEVQKRIRAYIEEQE